MNKSRIPYCCRWWDGDDGWRGEVDLDGSMMMRRRKSLVSADATVCEEKVQR